jgi:quercetin dioxygenase-like cupin family protein
MSKEFHANSASLAEVEPVMDVIPLKGVKPAFFDLKVPLVDKGRDVVSPAYTDNLWFKLKSYASGGENALHAHPYQDHSFIVLQGSARFYGPNGETKDLIAYQGIMLPAGCFYRFECTSKENLVLLRIASHASDRSKNPNYRVNINGVYMDPTSEENNEVERVYSGKFFGPASEVNQ